MDLDPYWTDEATFILRTHMRRKKWGFKKLAAKLAEVGVVYTEVTLSNKIARGTFSFAFYLQCIRLMDVSDATVSQVLSKAEERG